MGGNSIGISGGVEKDNASEEGEGWGHWFGLKAGMYRREYNVHIH